MRMGKYSKKITSVDWLKNLETSHFTPYILNNAAAGFSCGVNALSTLTGVHPQEIRQITGKSDHLGDRKAIKYLKDRGYGVHEITQSKVTADDWPEDPISQKHVLLVSQLRIRNEGTWAVCYNNLWIHNFEIEGLTPFRFVNSPIMTMYAITHYKWGNKIQKEGEKCKKQDYYLSF